MDFFTWTKKKKPVEPAVAQGDAGLYLRDDLARERILDADFIALVHLPSCIDSKEWIATHTVGFVEHINMLCGAVSEFCLPSTCPSLCLPAPLPSTAKTELMWVADDKGKTKLKCSAREYTDYTLSFCQRCIIDETLFPTKYGNVFSSTFDATLRKIFRLLMHVIAHLYHAHYRQIVALELHGCLNTLTYHFMLFVRAYCLLEEKESAFLTEIAERLHREPTPGAPSEISNAVTPTALEDIYIMPSDAAIKPSVNDIFPNECASFISDTTIKYTSARSVSSTANTHCVAATKINSPNTGLSAIAVATPITGATVSNTIANSSLVASSVASRNVTAGVVANENLSPLQVTSNTEHEAANGVLRSVQLNTSSAEIKRGTYGNGSTKAATMEENGNEVAKTKASNSKKKLSAVTDVASEMF